MNIRFPFENAGKDKFGHIWRPVAKVSLKSLTKESWVTVWMIVDTGADYTIIPRHFSEKLKISLERDCVKNEMPALLGRLGFFETFNTEFLKSHLVIFKE